MKAARQLDHNRAAAKTIRLVLTTRLNDLCALRDGGLSLHTGQSRDLRMAARCLSYAIEYFRPFIDYACLEQEHQYIDQIVSLLGEVIDEEAFIKSLVKIQPTAPTEFVRGIEMLTEDRRVRLAGLVKGVTNQLTLDEFKALQEDFRQGLTRALKAGGNDVNSQDMARTVVLACAEEMRTSSTALYRPSKTRTSHRLRISIRKLRDALNLFAPYLGSGLDSLASELAPVQAALGKLRGCDLKLNALGDYLTEHHAGVIDGAGISPQWPAAIWLLGHFFERRPKHYRKVLSAGTELLSNGFAPRLADALSASESRRGLEKGEAFQELPLLDLAR